MIIKSVDGTSYTLRDWINNKEFSLMAEAQMMLLKETGKLCNWNEARMVAINSDAGKKDKEALTKQMLEGNVLGTYQQLVSKASQSLILSPVVEDFDALPRDVIKAAEVQINALFTAEQPAPEEPQSKSKK